MEKSRECSLGFSFCRNFENVFNDHQPAKFCYIHTTSVVYFLVSLKDGVCVSSSVQVPLLPLDWVRNQQLRLHWLINPQIKGLNSFVRVYSYEIVRLYIHKMIVIPHFSLDNSAHSGAWLSWGHFKQRYWGRTAYQRPSFASLWIYW